LANEQAQDDSKVIEEEPEETDWEHEEVASEGRDHLKDD
jgi:hypothetical protein